MGFQLSAANSGPFRQKFGCFVFNQFRNLSFTGL